MSKLNEIRDRTREYIGFGKPKIAHPAFDQGWYFAMALNLPVKFYLWTTITNDEARIDAIGYDKFSSENMEEHLFDYYVENVFKSE